VGKGKWVFVLFIKEKSPSPFFNGIAKCYTMHGATWSHKWSSDSWILYLLYTFVLYGYSVTTLLCTLSTRNIQLCIREIMLGKKHLEYHQALYFKHSYVSLTLAYFTASTGVLMSHIWLQYQLVTRLLCC